MYVQLVNKNFNIVSIAMRKAIGYSRVTGNIQLGKIVI